MQQCNESGIRTFISFSVFWFSIIGEHSKKDLALIGDSVGKKLSKLSRKLVKTAPKLRTVFMCGKKFCNSFSLKVGKQFRKKTRNFFERVLHFNLQGWNFAKIHQPKKKKKNSDRESGHNNPRRGKVGYCNCYDLHDFKAFYYLSDLPTVVVLM